MDIVKKFKELGGKFYSKKLGYTPDNDELNNLIDEINGALPENVRIQDLSVNDRKKVARQLAKSESFSDVTPRLKNKLVDAQKEGLIDTILTGMSLIPGKYSQAEIQRFESHLRTLPYSEIENNWGGIY